MRLRAAWVATALSLASCGRPCTALEFQRSGTPRLRLCAQRVTSESDRRRGLQGRAPLAPDEALILTAPVEDELCITNANVAFAIDAAFVSAAGEVVFVEQAIEPDDATLRCHQGTRDIIETAAGVLPRIEAGDYVR